MLLFVQLERRERLKRIVAERGVPLTSAFGDSGQDIIVQVTKDQKELFYTEGPASLMTARNDLTTWSLHRAKDRIGTAKRKRAAGDEVRSMFTVSNNSMGVLSAVRIP